MTSYREQKLRRLLDEHCVVDLNTHEVRDNHESYFTKLLPYAVLFEIPEDKQHIIDGALHYLHKNKVRCLYW